MINVTLLFSKVMLLLLMIVPGFAVTKAKIADGKLAKSLADTVIYIAQPALLISSFLRPYDAEIMKNSAFVFLISMVAHSIFYFVSLLFFKSASSAETKVLRYATVFANVGYMGLPLIVSLLGEDAAIYCSFYLIAFNIFAWSVGCLIYTGDKKYMSLKKMILNPAIIPSLIGLVLFLFSADKYIPVILTDALNMLKVLVAPLTMIMLGIRLAEVKFKGALKDKHMIMSFLLRHLVLPAFIWVILYILKITGIFTDTMAMSIILICASTPAAAATSMFAEKFDGDAVYASKVVSIGTILSLITMPLISLLLYI